MDEHLNINWLRMDKVNKRLNRQYILIALIFLAFAFLFTIIFVSLGWMC